MKNTFITLALAAGIATAAPTQLRKRTDIDATILNYALTLEHLEAAFYAQGIAMFNQGSFAKAGFNEPNFYKNLKEVAHDEATHVSFLTGALTAAGYNATAACTYDFGNLTPKSFIETASILEGVGVSAYLGAAALITNKDYLTAAASILTVEARHSSFMRNAIEESPFPQPFDVPLDFDQVYSLAAPFIKACPASNPPLPVKAFPALTLVNDCPAIQGRVAQFTIAKGTTLPAGQLYIAYPLVTGPLFMPATVNNGVVSATVPEAANGPAGQSYAILTTSNMTVTDDNTVAGPALVEVISPYWSH